MNHLTRHLRLTDEDAPSLRLAFASGDKKTVDQHFGSCERLMVYGVAPDRYELLQVAGFNVAQGHDLDKLESRMRVLDGCFAVYCVAVGESVFRQLLARGIRAIRVEAGTRIPDLIAQLQAQWPTTGQHQARTSKDPSRFAQFEDGGWD